MRNNKRSWQRCCVGWLFMLQIVSMPALAAFGMQTMAHDADMLWPLLPGESVQTLAAKLYPQNQILQQRFVQQALTLSRHRGIQLNANQTAHRAQLIAVPEAQAMHQLTRRIKKAEESFDDEITPEGQRLVMSMQITSAGHPMHTSLLPGAQQQRWAIHRPSWLDRQTIQQPWDALHLPDWHLSAWDAMHLEFHGLDLTRIEAIKHALWAHSQHRLDAIKQAAHRGLQGLQQLALKTQANYQANTQAIARTPLKEMHHHLQLATIVASALLLLVLSVTWGLLERRKR